MIHELVIAWMLGLIGGVIPGPVITTVFTEILQSGYLKSLRIIMIALITETLVALVSLLVLESLNFNEAFFRGLSLAGAAILVWIAISLWKVKSLDSEQKVHFGLWKVVLMILSNGVLWTYWITICIPKAILLGEQLNLGQYLFMGLVQLGWLVSTLVVAFLFSRFRKVLSRPRIIPLLFKLFALAFAYFAIDMLYKSLHFFLQC
ncbi:MAG: LysE family transporter [Bacteroidales bacterium]|nr:LysE family transporter [Bacteroidales bacterium]